MKMIALDLDGTILKSDESISKRSLATLEKCRKRGILIAIATARSKFSTKIFTDFFTPDVLIYDGGTIAAMGDEIIYNRQLEKDFANELIGSILENGYVTFSAQGDEGYFCNREPRSPYAERRAQAGYRVEAYNAEIGLDAPIYKVTAVMEADDSARLAKKYPQLGFISYTGFPYVRIALNDATKEHAVAAVAEHLGICLSQVVAFGDDFNDIGMLTKCGVGVAMGNAITEVKAVADHITASNDNDGVAVWIEENIL